MLDHPALPEMSGQRQELFSFVYFDPNGLRFYIVAADKWQFIKPHTSSLLQPPTHILHTDKKKCFLRNYGNLCPQGCFRHPESPNLYVQFVYAFAPIPL